MKLISDWMDAKSMLDYYKDLEKDLRIEMLNHLFPTSSVGRFSAEVGNLVVKAEFGLNYNLKIDEDDIGSLTAEELNCIKMKPTLVMSEYKRLSAEQREALDSFITITPALPSVKVEEL